MAFKFFHRVISSLEDATHNFEQLEQGSVYEPGDLILGAGTSRVGALLCDGGSYATATQPGLFAVIGYTFGGSGASFKVPDLRGRVPVGAGTGSGLTARSLGQTGGEENHTLSGGEMPVHNHGGATGGMSANDPHSHNVPVAGAGIGASAADGVARTGTIASDSTSIAHTHSIFNDGSGGSHNTMQPFGVINYFIKT